MSGYAVPVFLPRRRRIVTPGEWLRERLEEQRRAREATIVQAIGLVAGQVGSNHTSGGTPLAATLPVAPTAGNLLVGFAAAATSTGTINAPASWIAGPKSNGQAGDQVSAFYKVATGSEGTSFSFSEVAGNLIFVGVLEYSGVDTVTPNDATGTINSGALGGVNGMVMTVPALGTGSTMIVGAGFQVSSAVAISGFATMTSRINITDPFPSAFFVGEEASDTTSNRTGTSDAGGGWETVALRLRPGGAAPPSRLVQPLLMKLSR